MNTTISISKRLAIAVMLFSGALMAPAQVSRPLGTLPPGASVTLTFDVRINTPFSANTAAVTNQGSLTGLGFGPILTDDPATLLANDPTITAITVAPQITCPPDIITSAGCTQPSISFGADIITGVPTPTLVYKLGDTVITSPYAFPAGTNTVVVTASNGTTPDAVCSFTVIVRPNQPQLRILPVGTNVVLSWPSDFSCYSLQVASALLAPGANVWTQVPGPFTSQGGYLYATNRITTTQQFFRLSN